MASPRAQCDLHFEERPGYLYACYRSDEITLAAAIDCFSRVAEKCSELNCKRLLLERDVPVMMNHIDLYRASVHLQELTIGIHVAVVNRHTKMHSDLEFAIIVANNR